MIWAKNWSGAGYSGWNRSFEIGYGIFVNDWTNALGAGSGDGWLTDQRYLTIDNWCVVPRRQDQGAGPAAVDGGGRNPKMDLITGGID